MVGWELEAGTRAASSHSGSSSQRLFISSLKCFRLLGLSPFQLWTWWKTCSITQRGRLGFSSLGSRAAQRPRSSASSCLSCLHGPVSLHVLGTRQDEGEQRELGVSRLGGGRTALVPALGDARAPWRMRALDVCSWG